MSVRPHLVILGAPYIEYLRGNKALASALSAITAAVVGVILNLALWFSLHTLFATVDEVHWLGVRWFVAVWSTIDLAATSLTAAALVATFRFKTGRVATLLESVVAGAALYVLAGS